MASSHYGKLIAGHQSKVPSITSKGIASESTMQAIYDVVIELGREVMMGRLMETALNRH